MVLGVKVSLLGFIDKLLIERAYIDNGPDNESEPAVSLYLF